MSQNLIIVAGITLAAVMAGLVLLYTPEPTRSTQPKPAQWEVQAWADSHCDLCRKGLTTNPQDGLYTISGKEYWLHQACAKKLSKTHRRH